MECSGVVKGLKPGGSDALRIRDSEAGPFDEILGKPGAEYKDEIFFISSRGVDNIFF